MTCFNSSLFIHGFLGESDSIKEISGICLYSLSKMNDFEIVDFLHREYSEKKIVFAYSMGGRFALRFYKDFFHKLERVYLISCHYGLNNPEKTNRAIFEDHVLKKIGEPDFLSYWNDLKIFEGDKPLVENLKRELEDYKHLFMRWRLSHQENYKTLLKEAKNIKIVLGEYDNKYLDLYEGFDQKIVISKKGHRINTIDDFRSILERDFPSH